MFCTSRKPESRKRFFLRSTALFAAVTFFFSDFAVYAGSAPVTPAIIKNVPVFSLSPELGVIDESFKASGKTLIFIQDAHDSLEAQVHIAAIIRHAVENYGVQTVFEEGYEGPVPGDDYFGVIEDPEVRERVSYYLMDQLRIGGAEYAYINRGRDFRLIGSDDARLHRENIEWYRRTAKLQAAAKRDLDVLHKEIRLLAHRFFPAELKQWMKLKKRRDEDKLSFADYLQRLKEIAPAFFTKASAEAFEARFPNLSLLYRSAEEDIAKLEREIDPKPLFREIEILENDIAGLFLAGERDRQVFRYYKAIELLKRLNSLEVSAAEYEVLKENLSDYTTGEFADFIVRHRGKSIAVSKRWEENVRNAMEFYETARLRDHAVEKKIQKFLLDPAEKTAVLVFGGFHHNAIRSILRKHGLSYYVVTPRITEIKEEHQEQYRRLMTAGYRQRFKVPQNVSLAARAPSDFAVAGLSPEQENLFRAELRKMTDVVEALKAAGRTEEISSWQIGEALKRGDFNGRSELRVFSEETEEIERAAFEPLIGIEKIEVDPGVFPHAGSSEEPLALESNLELSLHFARYGVMHAVERAKTLLKQKGSAAVLGIGGGAGIDAMTAVYQILMFQKVPVLDMELIELHESALLNMSRNIEAQLKALGIPFRFLESENTFDLGERGRIRLRKVEMGEEFGPLLKASKRFDLIFFNAPSVIRDELEPDGKNLLEMPASVFENILEPLPDLLSEEGEAVIETSPLGHAAAVKFSEAGALSVLPKGPFDPLELSRVLMSLRRADGRSELRTGSPGDLEEAKWQAVNETTIKSFAGALQEAAIKDISGEAIFVFDMQEARMRYVIRPREENGQHFFHQRLTGNYTGQGFVISGVYEAFKSGHRSLVLSPRMTGGAGWEQVNLKGRFNEVVVPLIRILIAGGIPPKTSLLGGMFTDTETQEQLWNLADVVRAADNGRLIEIEWHQKPQWKPVLIVEEALQEYFPDLAREKKPAGLPAFMLRPLDLQEDQAQIQSWAAAAGRSGEPYYPALFQESLGFFTVEEGIEQLHGYLSYEEIYSGFDPVLRSFTYSLAIPKAEVRPQSELLRGREKAIALALLDYLLKYAHESGIVKNGISFYPGLQPNAAALTAAAEQAGFIAKVSGLYEMSRPSAAVRYESHHLSSRLNRYYRSELRTSSSQGFLSNEAIGPRAELRSEESAETRRELDRELAIIKEYGGFGLPQAELTEREYSGAWDGIIEEAREKKDEEAVQVFQRWKARPFHVLYGQLVYDPQTDKAGVILGFAGTGKSTLADNLKKSGFKHYGDDEVIVFPRDGKVYAFGNLEAKPSPISARGRRIKVDETPRMFPVEFVIHLSHTTKVRKRQSKQAGKPVLEHLKSRNGFHVLVKRDEARKEGIIALLRKLPVLTFGHASKTSLENNYAMKERMKDETVWVREWLDELSARSELRAVSPESASENRFVIPSSPEEKARLTLERQRLDEEYPELLPWTTSRANRATQNALRETAEAVRSLLPKGARGTGLRAVRSLISGLMHYPSHLNFLEEILKRVEADPAAEFEALKEAEDSFMSLEDSDAIRNYFSGKSGLDEVGTGALQESLEEAEYYFVLRLIYESAAKEKSFSESLMRTLREADARIADIARWDLLHRFPEAAGLRMVRGVPGEKTPDIASGASGGTLPVENYFTHDIDHAMDFAEPWIVVSEIPLESIRRISWAFYSPWQRVYEPEAVVSGDIGTTRVFHRERFKDLKAWIGFREEYDTDIHALRRRGLFDKRELSRRTDLRSWYAAQLEGIIYRRFREDARPSVKEYFRNIEESAASIREISGAVERALEQNQDLAKAVDAVEGLTEEALGLETPEQADAMLSQAFRAELRQQPGKESFLGSHILSLGGKRGNGTITVQILSAFPMAPALTRAVFENQKERLRQRFERARKELGIEGMVNVKWIRTAGTDALRRELKIGRSQLLIIQAGYSEREPVKVMLNELAPGVPVFTGFQDALAGESMTEILKARSELRSFEARAADPFQEAKALLKLIENNHLSASLASEAGDAWWENPVVLVRVAADQPELISRAQTVLARITSKHALYDFDTSGQALWAKIRHPDLASYLNYRSGGEAIGSRSELRSPVLTPEELERVKASFPSAESFFDQIDAWEKAHPDSKLLVFVRHGESMSNLFHYSQSYDSFSPLTLMGRKQAQGMAAFFKRKGIVFDRMISSNLERAFESLNMLAAQNGSTPVTLRRFREILLLPFGEIPMQILNAADPDLWSRFTQNPETFYLPGGHFSGQKFKEYFEKFIQKDFSGHPARRTIVASHGLTILLSLMYLLDIPRDKYENLHPLLGNSPNLGITILAYHPQAARPWEILVYGDNSYLDPSLHGRTTNRWEKFRNRLLFYWLALWRSVKAWVVKRTDFPSDYFPTRRTFFGVGKERTERALEDYRIYPIVSLQDLNWRVDDEARLIDANEFPQVRVLYQGREIAAAQAGPVYGLGRTVRKKIREMEGGRAEGAAKNSNFSVTHRDGAVLIQKIGQSAEETRSELGSAAGASGQEKDFGAGHSGQLTEILEVIQTAEPVPDVDTMIYPEKLLDLARDLQRAVPESWGRVALHQTLAGRLSILSEGIKGAIDAEAWRQSAGNRFYYTEYDMSQIYFLSEMNQRADAVLDLTEGKAPVPTLMGHGTVGDVGLILFPAAALAGIESYQKKASALDSLVSKNGFAVDWEGIELPSGTSLRPEPLLAVDLSMDEALEKETDAAIREALRVKGLEGNELAFREIKRAALAAFYLQKITEAFGRSELRTNDGGPDSGSGKTQNKRVLPYQEIEYEYETSGRIRRVTLDNVDHPGEKIVLENISYSSDGREFDFVQPGGPAGDAIGVHFEFHDTYAELRNIDVNDPALRRHGIAKSIALWVLKQAVDRYPDQANPLVLHLVQNPIIFSLAEYLFSPDTIELYYVWDDKWYSPAAPDADIYGWFGPVTIYDAGPHQYKKIAVKRRDDGSFAAAAPEGVRVVMDGHKMTVTDAASGEKLDHLSFDTLRFDLRGVSRDITPPPGGESAAARSELRNSEEEVLSRIIQGGLILRMLGYEGFPALEQRLSKTSPEDLGAELARRTIKLPEGDQALIHRFAFSGESGISGLAALNLQRVRSLAALHPEQSLAEVLAYGLTQASRRRHLGQWIGGALNLFYGNPLAAAAARMAAGSLPAKPENSNRPAEREIRDENWIRSMGYITGLEDELTGRMEEAEAGIAGRFDFFTRWNSGWPDRDRILAAQITRNGRWDPEHAWDSIYNLPQKWFFSQWREIIRPFMPRLLEIVHQAEDEAERKIQMGHPEWEAFYRKHHREYPAYDVSYLQDFFTTRVVSNAMRPFVFRIAEPYIQEAVLQYRALQLLSDEDFDLVRKNWFAEDGKPWDEALYSDPRKFKEKARRQVRSKSEELERRIEALRWRIEEFKQGKGINGISPDASRLAIDEAELKELLKERAASENLLQSFLEEPLHSLWDGTGYKGQRSGIQTSGPEGFRSNEPAEARSELRPIKLTASQIKKVRAAYPEIDNQGAVKNWERKLNEIREKLGADPKELVTLFLSFPRLISYSPDNLKRKWDVLAKMGTPAAERLEALRSIIALNVETLEAIAKEAEAQGVRVLTANEFRRIFYRLDRSFVIDGRRATIAAYRNNIDKKVRFESIGNDEIDQKGIEKKIEEAFEAGLRQKLPGIITEVLGRSELRASSEERSEESRLKKARQVFRRRALLIAFAGSALGVSSAIFFSLPDVKEKPPAISEAVIERRQFATIRGIHINDNTRDAYSQTPELIDAIAEGVDASDRMRRSQIRDFSLGDSSAPGAEAGQMTFRVQVQEGAIVDPPFEDIRIRRSDDGKPSPLDLQELKISLSGGRVRTVEEVGEWIAWAPLGALGLVAVLVYALTRSMRRVETGGVFAAHEKAKQAQADLKVIRGRAEEKRKEREGDNRAELRSPEERLSLKEILGPEEAKLMERFFAEGYWIEFQKLSAAEEKEEIEVLVHHSSPSKFRPGRISPGRYLIESGKDGVLQLSGIYPGLPGGLGYGRIFIALSLLMLYSGKENRKNFEIHAIQSRSLIQSLERIHSFGIEKIVPRAYHGAYPDIAVRGKIPLIDDEDLRTVVTLNDKNKNAETKARAELRNDSVQAVEENLWETKGAAERYARFAEDEGYTAANRRLLSFSGLKPGDHVVDLGSGTGSGTKLIAERVGSEGRVYGIDSAGAMAAFAKQSVPGSNVDFRVGNAAELNSLVPEPASAVLSFNAVHLMDPEDLFREVYEKLEPGGKFAFNSTFYPEAQPAEESGYYELAKHILKITGERYDSKTAGRRKKVKFPEIKQYLEAAREAGFRKENIRTETVTFYLPLESIETFFMIPGLSETLMPAGIPEKERQEIVREAVARARAQGITTIRRSWFYFSAVKAAESTRGGEPRQARFELRDSRRTGEPAVIPFEEMALPTGVFLEAEELARLEEKDAETYFDELLVLIERHKAFDVYIEETGSFSDQDILSEKFHKLAGEHPERIHFLRRGRAHLSKKKVLIHLSFFGETQSARETEEALDRLKKEYGVEEILPLDYTRAGALSAFLTLAESLTSAALLREVSEAFAVRGPNGRWRLAADYAASLWTRMQADYAVQWSA